jgi:hypothetical protein
LDGREDSCAQPLRLLDQVVEISWKSSQQLRGLFVGAGHHAIARKFADKGTSTPVVVDETERNALRADLED